MVVTEIAPGDHLGNPVVVFIRPFQNALFPQSATFSAVPFITSSSTSSGDVPESAEADGAAASLIAAFTALSLARSAVAPPLASSNSSQRM